MESHTLQQFMEQMPAAIAIFDAQMRYLAVSHHFLSDMEFLFSTRAFSPAEALGCSHYELFPKMPLRWRDIHARVLAGEELAEQEDWVRRQDGCADCIRWSMKPWRNVSGQIGGALCFCEVITEQVEVRRALAVSEARFRATFENAAVGLTHAAPDGRFLRFNSALPRLLGWPADELITKSIWEITHPDDLALERAQFKDLEDGRIESYSLEKRDLRKDGTTIWIRLTRSAVRKSDGSADYFVAVVEDISARKRAEEELRKSEERFRTSILLSPAPTILYDDREQILAVSQSWLAAAGISAGELNKMEDWTIRAYGTRSDEVLKSIRRIIVTEPVARPDELTVFTSTGDERLWNFVTSGLGTLSDGRRLFVSVAEDVTDRRAYEERIHLLMREARHRTKNILGLVQAIARQTAAGGDAQDFIGRFTERIQALAANQDLLVRQQFQRIDVKDLVQVQLAHFADLIGTRIKFGGPKLYLNAAAAQAIGLALHELATNAGKYGALSTDAGGVDVRWQIDDGTFAMSWIERNGPPVRPPGHRGFGSTVTESMVKQTLGGDVQLDYAPSGLAWCLTCHAANALEETARPASRADSVQL